MVQEVEERRYPQPGDPLNALPPLGAAGDDGRRGRGLAGRGARRRVKAKKTSAKDNSGELVKPDTFIIKNPFNYVKGLLPRVKYHWDRVRQGTTGWEKVPSSS